MKVSKIQSKATYHKCIRELNDFGYLSYQPSYNPFKGSLVYLFNFQSAVNKVDKQTKIETSSELALNEYLTKNETSSELALNKQRTSTEQALVSYINNTNIINNTNTTNRNKQQTRVNSLTQKKSNEKNIKSSEPDSGKYAGTRKKSSAALARPNESSQHQEDAAEVLRDTKPGRERPLREEARSYFSGKHASEKEADKFYNHYESNGWLVGGKAEMQNWQASADKWMLNTEVFSASNTKSSKRSALSADKDYSEPL